MNQNPEQLTARDPKPRSRNVFIFYRPESFREWLKNSKSLGGRLHDIPALPEEELIECQIIAINNLEHPFKQNRPGAFTNGNRLGKFYFHFIYSPPVEIC